VHALTREAVASFPELTDRAPLALVVDTFLMRAANSDKARTRDLATRQDRTRGAVATQEPRLCSTRRPERGPYLVKLFRCYSDPEVKRIIPVIHLEEAAPSSLA
jgi:hypothetical protein